MNIEDLAIYKRFLSKFTDNKKKALDGLNTIKEILNTESKETSEMLEIYRKYIAGEELDEDAIKKANNQFTDLNVEEEKINGTFKYFVDAGNSKIEADRLKINLRNLGFKGAFIVAFLDGKQISTKEALNLQNKLKENE